MASGFNRGEGEELDRNDLSYFSLSGADVLSVVAGDSILAEAILARLQEKGVDGIISFPDWWIDFEEGKPDHAKGALSFKIKWVGLIR